MMMLMDVKSCRGAAEGNEKLKQKLKKKLWVQGLVRVSGSCGGQVHPVSRKDESHEKAIDQFFVKKTICGVLDYHQCQPS